MTMRLTWQKRLKRILFSILIKRLFLEGGKSRVTRLSAEFVFRMHAKYPSAELFHSREKLWNTFGKHLTQQQWIGFEFGVASGDATKAFLKMSYTEKCLGWHGFDTFMGLPSEWGDLPKGAFSTNGVPPQIKNDLLNVETTQYKSHISYHSWINQQKQHIIPVKTFKKNLYYDLMCSPMDYFPCMIKMMKQVEKEEQTICNVFPMRNEIIPKHIRLDTTTLVHLLMTKKQGNKSDYLTEGNLKRNENKIWEFFFRTERKCFHKKHYEFHHMIETDGISCSLLLLRKDLIGKKLPMMKKGINNEEYIDELKDYSQLQNKKIVGIDPGKNDLIYCVDACNKEANKFRYSQDQRRKETKKKKYSKIHLELKKEKINGKTIIEWETELSKLNRKSLNIQKFKEYIQKKSEINHMLFTFYEKYIFRKLRLQSYRNTKKSEQKMINQFKKIFGNEKDVVVCFGDYEQKQQMKYKEATKGKGMRTLFRKAGFQTYMVDEFRTSCRCSKCEIGICAKNMVMENPRPYKTGNILVHGLICCKNGCGYWNRDVNGATNIYKIAYNAINNKERPNYLSRSNNSSGFLEEFPKSKFTLSVMSKPC